jgi:predicted SAM-dependent methyltransferase
MIKVNLGSAGYKKEGYINVDWQPIVKPDIVHDLNVFPYPFTDSSVDLVEASHVLEHLNRPFDVMKEIHRILKPGGKAIIKVPHFSRGMTHAEHFHGFDVTFPNYFNRKFSKTGYFGIDFRLQKMRMRWMVFIYEIEEMGYGKPTISFLKIINPAISFFANMSPMFCSRVWCFWVGGFEEIEFSFIAEK